MVAAKSVVGGVLAMMAPKHKCPSSTPRAVMEKTVFVLWVSLVIVGGLAVAGFFAVCFMENRAEAAVLAANFSALFTGVIGVGAIGIGIIMQQLDDAHVDQKARGEEALAQRLEMETLGAQLDDATRHLLPEIEAVCMPDFAWCSYTTVYHTNWTEAKGLHQAIRVLTAADFQRFLVRLERMTSDTNLRVSLEAYYPSLFLAIKKYKKCTRTLPEWTDLGRVNVDEDTIIKRTELLGRHEKFVACTGLAEAVASGYIASYSVTSPQYYVNAKAFLAFAGQRGWLDEVPYTPEILNNSGLNKLLRVTDIPVFP